MSFDYLRHHLNEHAGKNTETITSSTNRTLFLSATSSKTIFPLVLETLTTIHFSSCNEQTLENILKLDYLLLLPFHNIENRFFQRSEIIFLKIVEFFKLKHLNAVNTLMHKKPPTHLATASALGVPNSLKEIQP
jgi:hypothetical protein